ncbi:sodium:solute symporter family protein [Bacteriovoracaceae bacterium]|nr:sodium:solute symporter family protein [Bacteriovoracaceae bacterium]
MNLSQSYFSFLDKFDFIVFSLVFIFTIIAVIWGNSKKKKIKSTKQDDRNGIIETLLMGRQLTLPLFVGTLVATWYGGILGVTQISFEYGIYNFLTQGVFWYVTYLIFALFLVSKIKQTQSITLPELIKHKFGPKSAKVAAIFNFFNVVPIAYTLSVGIIIKSLFGFSLNYSMMIGLTFILIYSSFGGLRAVVFSDMVQFFVMCLSVLLVVLFSFSEYGGISFLQENLPAGHFDPTGGQSILTIFVWGIIALSTLVDPNFYQRVFAAQSEAVAKKGIYISTIVWICFDVCTTLGGLYARAVLGGEADSGTAYIYYFLQLLPSGLRGLVLAGIVATILSTIDSYLFVASTTFNYDLFPKLIKKFKHSVHFGVVLIGGLSLVLANSFDGSIKAVWKTLGSYSSACLLVPVLYGQMFKKYKISDIHFVLTCSLSAIGVTVWRLVERNGIWAEVDEIYIGILLSILSLSLGIFSQKFGLIQNIVTLMKDNTSKK